MSAPCRPLVVVFLLLCVAGALQSWTQITLNFENVSFSATTTADGRVQFVPSAGGSGTLKNERNQTIAQGDLSVRGRTLVINGKTGATFAYGVKEEAFADNAFPMDEVKEFASIELTKGNRWALKDANFYFVFELPSGRPELVLNLDNSLGRASIITLPRGVVRLWGYAITVEKKTGTVKFAHGKIIEASDASYTPAVATLSPQSPQPMPAPSAEQTERSESLQTGQWQRPPAPTAEAVRSANFGPKPDPAPVVAFLQSHSLGTSRVANALGSLADSVGGVRPEPAFGPALLGEPKKDYVFISGGTGGAGTYRFGWVQKAYDDNGHGLRRFTYFFVHDGVLELVSRYPNENCLIPRAALASAEKLREAQKTCYAQIGQAVVELSGEYTVKGKLPSSASDTWTTNSTVRILPGMTVSEAKKTAKAALVGALEYKSGVLLIGGRCDLVVSQRLQMVCNTASGEPLTGEGSEWFVLRQGRIYAREWRQTEFPDK